MSCTNTNSQTQTQLTKHDVGWRRIVRNFTPSWFSVTMGTGIVSILLNTLPYNAQWLYWISVVIFAINVLLFITGCIISFLRYILYPEIFGAMIVHPVQSMFIGTFPMGLTTIINMFCFVCVPVWGEWTRNFAWGLWIFDAILSVVTALSLPFLLYALTIRSMAHGNETQLSSMTAVWLLPIVSCIVAASSGAIVADVLPNPQHALWTVLVSYVLWGIGRLTLHKLPPKAVIVSVFLPLGPLGQGGYGAMKLGKSAQTIFAQTHTLEASSGPTFYTLGFLVALILWSFGLVWLFFASASIARCRNFPFNIGCTCQIGRELPSEFFKVLGTIISLCVVVLWMVVSIGTLKGVVSGKLFFAPCLADLKLKEEDKDVAKAA
ncbi:TDT family transporter [Aspergillus novofumigatus IBT 16806]|uniref:Sulfite transporter Ssu1 n=1 Tax=Aspergillus novofumigatus (strain IBT 16806) TaxID=1392255 RepID=A0A2I1BY90_ASPN1|nr:sulfite transporter Ssu1 [Aspergillus novofumigatus IBT 16806]PKX90342.1 sulfite transporter Ssu1 [Aspergillus novofumigatus IBT 16806]